MMSFGPRVRELRVASGLSLSELARRAGIGKSTLSEIEAGRRNATVETLYALCQPLDVPLTAIVGEAPGSGSEAAGGMRTVLLSVRHLPERTVEVFRLEFPAGASHASPAHSPGVTEHITVVEGTVLVGPVGEESSVRSGESFSWASDARHRYAAIDGPAEAVLVIVTPR